MPQRRQTPVGATWDEGFRATGQVTQQVACHRFAMHSFYQDTGARSLAFSKSTDVHARSNLAIGKAFRDNRKHTLDARIAMQMRLPSTEKLYHQAGANLLAA